MSRVARSLAAALLALLLAVPAAAQLSDFTTGYRYDQARRLTGTISPDPDGTGPLGRPAVRNSYDDTGRLVKVETGWLSAWQAESIAPSAWTGFTVVSILETDYDAMSRKVSETATQPGGPALTLTQYSYDSLGRPECTAVRMNPAAFGSLPGSACSLGPEGTNGPDRISRQVHDAAGQLVQLREGVGTAVEAAEATFSYTPNGKRSTVIDANGNRAALEYDGFDRQSKWVFPSKTRPTGFIDSTPANALLTAGSVNAADYEQYGYDPNGNRTSLRKRDGLTLTYQYDALNRMTRKTVPERSGLPVVHTRDVYYAYDLRGLMTEARFGSLTGPGITNTYDGFGRLASSTNTVTGFTHELEYRYDKDGNRTAIQHSDDEWFTYRRDNLGRTTQIYEGDAASWDSNTLLLRFNYNNDATLLSRIWGSGSLGATQSYQHDPLGRLTRIGQSLSGTAHDIGLNFVINPASQIGKQTRSNDLYAYTALANRDDDYAANGLNQYTAVDGTGFTYDANGNLTSDGSATYTYDVENRLVIASGAGSATLLYDPLGRLYRLSTTFHTNFAHDGDAVVAAYNSVGDFLNRYVHGDRPDSPLVQYTGNGLGWQNRDWLMADHQGSIIAIAGGDASLEAINAYDEYGRPGSSNEGRFQYTGQMWIPELGSSTCPGHYHYKARIYDPCFGRFLQVDPVGYEDQFNLYAYVGNDPVNATDPTGTRCYAVPIIEIRVCPPSLLPANRPSGPAPGGSAAAGGAILGVGGTAAIVGSVGYGRHFEMTYQRRPNLRLPPPPQRTKQGQTVFRVFGDKAGLFGKSWTPEDPRQMIDPADRLGLPPGNSAEKLAIGELRSLTDVEVQKATAIGTNRGGAIEYVIQTPELNVRINKIEPLKTCNSIINKEGCS